MSAVGGTPTEDDQIELGQCRYREAWVRGRWVEDMTAHTAIVEHCSPPASSEDKLDDTQA